VLEYSSSVASINAFVLLKRISVSIFFRALWLWPYLMRNAVKDGLAIR
jgi:hypothetical protein